MRAAVLTEPEDQPQARPVPAPAAGDVLIRVSVVGVCAPTPITHREGRIGEFVVGAPLILGHEAAGTIVAAGPGLQKNVSVTRFRSSRKRPDPDSDETRRGHYNCAHACGSTHAARAAHCASNVTIGAPFAHPVPDACRRRRRVVVTAVFAIAAIVKAAVSARSCPDFGRGTDRHYDGPGAGRSAPPISSSTDSTKSDAVSRSVLVRPPRWTPRDDVSGLAGGRVVDRVRRYRRRDRRRFPRCGPGSDVLVAWVRRTSGVAGTAHSERELTLTACSDMRYVPTAMSCALGAG